MQANSYPKPQARFEVEPTFGRVSDSLDPRYESCQQIRDPVYFRGPLRTVRILGRIGIVQFHVDVNWHDPERFRLILLGNYAFTVIIYQLIGLVRPGRPGSRTAIGTEP